jgi:hypothetical protein
MEEIKTKRCTKCGIVKPLSEFSNQKSRKDGKKTQCKACDKIYNDKHRADHRKERADYQAVYNKEHPDVLDRGRKKYAETHKEEIRESRLLRERSPEGREKKAKTRQEKKSKDPIHVLFTQTRSRAKQSGIVFTIEESDLTVPETCPVLGIPLRWEVGKRSPNTPSIDRLVPELGYIPGNVAVISWRANRLKNDGTAEELRLISDWMYSKASYNRPNNGQTTSRD